ncbi:MAG: hypothetical protein GY758_08500 [Fuerstiella sp.]|nr:hypothetical protein [Fuerstiella sp.]MCP4509759.1 hypothetical protein [Fuerstiella sp.]
MTTQDKVLIGPRHFQWNAGGWFGSSLGSSSWMLIASCFLVFCKQTALAWVPAFTFAIVVTVSIFLWKRRGRIYPFTAYMVLLGLLAIVIPLVYGIVLLNASDAAMSTMNWSRSISLFVAASGITPILILWFLFLERSADPNNGLNSTPNHTDEA